MKVIARPMGTGKTKELLQNAFNNSGQVLTVDKRALKVKADAYGIKVPIIDLQDFFYGNYQLSKPLYIHKLEDVTQE
ncbi:MAG: hypothetical protein K6C33_11745, partial [Desulfovibrio sp.]|nr:hypothetical protein [Desulfovibrio sp.]